MEVGVTECRKVLTTQVGRRQDEEAKGTETDISARTEEEIGRINKIHVW